MRKKFWKILGIGIVAGMIGGLGGGLKKGSLRLRENALRPSGRC